MDKTLEIDGALVKAAQELTGEADERAAVERVVREAASRAGAVRPPSLASYAGKFEFADGYDALVERGARVHPDRCVSFDPSASVMTEKSASFLGGLGGGLLGLNHTRNLEVF